MKKIFLTLLLAVGLLSGCSYAEPFEDTFFFTEIYVANSTSIHTLDGSTFLGGANVTAAAIIADTTIVRGDGGGRGVQDSGVTIDGFDNLNTNGGDIYGFDVYAVNDLQVTNDLEVLDEAYIADQL